MTITLSPILKRSLVATALIFGSAVVVPAAPSLAWDADRRVIPCGATHTIPAPFGAAGSYDNTAKSAVTIFVFTDGTKSPTDGHSLRHFISTTADGGLTFELKTTSVVVKAAQCPPSREYVPCKTDPLLPYDKSKGQSYSTRYTNDDHTEGTVVIYLDRERVEEPGHAVIHLFWTKDITANGKQYDCELKFKGVKVDGKSFVSVAAIAKGIKKT